MPHAMAKIAYLSKVESCIRTYFMVHKQNTYTDDSEAVDRDSPDVTFIRRTVYGAFIVFFIVLILYAVLEFPPSTYTYVNTILYVFACALGFAWVYVSWTNYFWQKDTEQKYNLLIPVLAVLYFVGCILFTIWAWN